MKKVREFFQFFLQNSIELFHYQVVGAWTPSMIHRPLMAQDIIDYVMDHEWEFGSNGKNFLIKTLDFRIFFDLTNNVCRRLPPVTVPG